MQIDKPVKERILDEVQRKRDDIVDALVKLVRIPSVVGDEAEAQRAVSHLYREAGLEVIEFVGDPERVKTHEAFIESNLPCANRPNIIGIKHGHRSSRSVILNGHIDVVSPEPVAQWTHDPWGGEIEDGKLYGRGSGDMKAGLVANLFALRTLQDSGFNPKGKILLQSVVGEEEGGGLGTLACLLGGYTADGLIITEPHGINVTVAMTGINYFRVKVYGRTAHAGLAHLGVNAIGKMYLIYEALKELDEQRGRQIKFDLFEKGSGRSTHLNIGTMKAGDWASTVAGEAVIECRISFVPGESQKEIRALVEKKIQEVANADPWMKEHPPVVEWYGWHAEPWLQDTSVPFVQLCKAVAEEVVGKEVDFIGRAAGLDARFASYFQIPALCMGPRAHAIHGIDECVELESILTLTGIMALFLARWCGLES